LLVSPIMRLKSLFQKDKLPILLLIVVPLIGIIPFAAFIVFGIYDYRVNGPKAAVVQADLESEFRAIQPLPQATPINFNATHKPRTALVSDKYRVKSNYAEIRSFYDQELSKHGWTFYEERNLKDWGQDSGGRSARYCKGPYRAELEYGGERSSSSWDYALSLSWGLSSDVGKYTELFKSAGCN
jgi:hypothetical protein